MLSSLTMSPYSHIDRQVMENLWINTQHGLHSLAQTQNHALAV